MEPVPVTIYTRSWCPYCQRALALLQRRGIGYRELSLDDGPAVREEMIARSGRRTVPQVFIGDHHVGGSDDLAAIERSGELDRLLAEHAQPANQPTP
ncbi:MAG: glutaredoxin 3 [Gammaproteobacteria bacterium]|nr:MAG: glutaredoxin 3 [Gammaproteobacteria bacterium]